MELIKASGPFFFLHLLEMYVVVFFIYFHAHLFVKYNLNYSVCQSQSQYQKPVMVDAPLAHSALIP